MSKNKLKIVSVVGFGGLGKTTLVKMVFDKIKGDFGCSAFIPVGRNADTKKVLMDILLDLGMYGNQFTMLDERQLIDKLREHLESKRYLIVIDDIWDKELWRVIKLAFSDSNNLGSRLITTTRISSVSKFCCSSINDSVYHMEPLSDDDSKRLFYKRIFSQECECPHEFEEVSIGILKKCGGVPLAIITIASLLASDQQVKPVFEWHGLLESIGCGLTENPSVEEMMRILSFSYYDLPSHLKTCLLYLSMFPEDRKIDKNQLIWMWISENFVQCEKRKTSLFEIGETYFNELVNRNLIQPVYDIHGIVYACRVHDSVLDLICLLSSEENFVTILNGACDSMSSQRNIRRLSLQKAKREEHPTAPLDSVSISQVRSITAFKPAIGIMPSFRSFVVLRVLDLTECDANANNPLNLRGLGCLFHLRYLGLAKTRIHELPEDVGKLQFLQVLDLTECSVNLPPTITRLRRLMCLLVNLGTHGGLGCRFLDEIGNMTSMEVLNVVYCSSLSTAKQLGNMERLRQLTICFSGSRLELEEAFVESLGKMPDIQYLNIWVRWVTCESVDVCRPMDLLGECWVPPPSLKEFIACTMKFSMMPAWIRGYPSHLTQLFKLEILVEQVRQDDLDSLGKLPALRILRLQNGRTSDRLLLIGADGFRCVTSFKLLPDQPGKIAFQPGALPKAERVHIRTRFAEEEAAGEDTDYFELGLESMSSLRRVEVELFHSGRTVGEARQAKAALVKALGTHPNRPWHFICMRPEIQAGDNDDKVYILDGESPVYIDRSDDEMPDLTMSELSDSEYQIYISDDESE